MSDNALAQYASQWDRDMLLPFARNNALAPQPPQQWGSTGDVMRTLDARQGHGWQFAVPGFLKDAYDAAAAVGGSAGGRPFVPSEQPELTENMIGHAGAIVGPMAAHGFARNALAPVGGAELGIFGGRRAKAADKPEQIFYHGSDQVFDKFDLNARKPGIMNEFLPKVRDYDLGIHMTPDRALAETYGKHVRGYRVDGDVMQVGSKWDAFPNGIGPRDMERLRRDGFSAVFAKKENEMIALDPDRIIPVDDGSMKAAGKAASEAVQGVRAYHGSPHDFDRFDMSKIGTGEGAQAYGHGLYFAENEGVAKSYRDSLTSQVRQQVDSNLSKWARHFKGQAGGDIDVALNSLKSVASRPDWAAEKTLMDQAITELTALKAAEKGRMYEVKINADPEHFLDWDKPLSQQSEKVQKALGWKGDEAAAAEADRIAKRIEALNKVIDSGGVKADAAIKEKSALLDQYDAVDATNAAWWKADARDRTARPEAAAKLREAGIPGIKYLDQGSRGAGDGSRNYVVFDDALIEIMRKYGLLPMAAGGAALAQPSDAQAAP